MEEKTVYHIDVNSAYLSWEAVYRLKFLGARTDLRRIPSAIGGDISQRHGIILAKSIPAKRYKIHTGEPVPQARQKCPDLLIAPPNYGLYERCSRAFVKILKEYSPDVEQYSIDEVYMDMNADHPSVWRSRPDGIRYQGPDKRGTGIYRECGHLNQQGSGQDGLGV